MNRTEQLMASEIERLEALIAACLRPLSNGWKPHEVGDHVVGFGSYDELDSAARELERRLVELEEGARSIPALSTGLDVMSQQKRQIVARRAGLHEVGDMAYRGDDGKDIAALAWEVLRETLKVKP